MASGVGAWRQPGCRGMVEKHRLPPPFVRLQPDILTMKMPTLKTLFMTILVLIIMSPGTSAEESWATSYRSLLDKYASDQGVAYKEWKANGKDLAMLQSIVNQIAQNGPTDTSRDGKIAYYANVYNILVLHGVLKAYPITSVQDIAPLFGFFTSPRFTVDGQKVSLNKIEKQWLLKQFQEPRIHFIVNCASVSCPPLPPAPLAAATLETQMDRATQNFLNDPQGVKVSEKTAYLSKIFEWYKADFKRAGGVIAFINRFREEKLPEDISMQYQNYNWGLNER